jgi:hypothetical protein
MSAEEDESEEGYETDSDEDSEEEEGRMMKPVFVSKENRLTIKDQEAKYQAEEELKKKKEIEKEEKKNLTRMKVIHQLHLVKF